MAENVSITNYYPQDIMEIHNRYRHIQILVKQQKAFSNGVKELKNKISQKSNDIKEIYNSTNYGPTSKEGQKNIGSRTKKLTEAETIYGIALPLPNELVDSQSHKWSSSESVIGGTLTSLAEKTGISKINKAVGEFASVSGMRKHLIDPGYFQDYEGTEPREFSFNWDLVPNNVDEASNILDILYHLKKYTLPTSTINGISMLSPFLFDIIIGNPHINSIMNMNNVVCSNLSINYSAEGAVQLFADGIPKYMSLSMTFAERATVTADFYNEG